MLSHYPAFNINLADKLNNDTALTCLHKVLDAGLPQESLVKLASILLDKHFSAEHVNGHQRTLLTYSVALGDSSLELTRCLLNHGAQVLPARSCDVLRDRSSFTWLVRSLMRTQTLDSHRQTLMLLCQNMTEMVGPEVTRSHVLTTMIHLGHSASIMAPLFIQLRALIAPYWSQPLNLAHLCRSSIRRSIGPKNVWQGARALNLPPSLTQYLHYDC